LLSLQYQDLMSRVRYQYLYSHVKPYNVYLFVTAIYLEMVVFRNARSRSLPSGP